MEKLPEKEIKDYAYDMIKVAIAGIPLIGGSANEFISSFLATPIQKRKDKWIESIVNEIISRLENIEDKSKFIKDLQDNEEFISTLLSATQAAMRTHHEEKILAFKNLTFNTINVKEKIEYIKIRPYIYHVEQLEPEHLLVLKFLSQWKENQSKYDKDHNKSNVQTSRDILSASELWNYFHKEFKANSELMEIIIKELYKYDLITQDNILMIDNNCMTKTGKDFIKYINEYKS